MEHTITKIVIEVNDPMEKSLKKYQATIEQLAKAMRLSEISGQHHHEKTEPTPYRSLHELTEQLRGLVGVGLRRVFENIVSVWLRKDITKALELPAGAEAMLKALPGDPFQLDNKIYINPSTGKPLTIAEYQTITRDLNAVFGHLFGVTPEAMMKRAMALGKVLQSMDTTRAVNTSLEALNPVVNEALVSTSSERYAAQEEFAGLHTAEMLQDISDSARRKVTTTILQAQRDRVDAKELEQRLFNSFVDLNRDWRRVAESETANNFNNGYLATMIDKAPVDKTLFMKGISGPGACDWCLENVSEEIVVLLDGPPAGGETVVVEGETYVAIWPGKSNFGRKAAQWWTAAGIQHPHCRCTWIQYIPGFEAAHQEMKEAMARWNAGNLED